MHLRTGAARATLARAAGLCFRGHSFASGNFSARYSQMARLSHTTVTAPSLRTGTRPEGEPAATMPRHRSALGMQAHQVFVSVNGAPVRL